MHIWQEGCILSYGNFVDADACPVRDIIYGEAHKRGIHITMVVSMAHNIYEMAGMDVLRVDSSFQAVDIAIVNRASPQDIVVTSDFGLASLVLGNGVRALSPPAGYIQSRILIHFSKKTCFRTTTERRGRVKGPKARRREDDDNFRKNLIKVDGREDMISNSYPPGPNAVEWVSRDKSVISQSYTRAYPLVVEKGEGVYIEDVDGNRYLDFTSGIATTSTGHCHPAVVEKIISQSKKLIHMSGTDFYYTSEIKLAEKLVTITPGKQPKKVFFTNSGTESNEAAMKLARYHTKRPLFISFIGGFYGRTMGSLSLSASKEVHRRGFAAFVPGVSHVPYAYCYRCAYGLKAVIVISTASGGLKKSYSGQRFLRKRLRQFY